MGARFSLTRHSAILATGMIAFAACLLYARTLGADFVYDARAKVLISPFIHDAGNFLDVITGRVITRDELDNNRPGMLLSLMVDAALWGKSPVGYHATSILLHGLVCGLLFLLALRLVGDPWAAGLAALLFAAHPLGCEPVAEVSYREDLLVAASMLVALLAGMEWRCRGGLASGLLCAAALLYGVSCKENGAAGPVVLAGWWWLWRGEPGKRRRFPWPLVAGSLAVGLFLLARFTLRPRVSLIFPNPPAPLAGTMPGILAIQVRIWAMQFLQVVIPRGLCADYTAWSLRGYGQVASLCGVALVVAAQVWHAARSRVGALGWLWFWAALLPVANLLPLYRPMADRFMYVPLVGAALAAAHGLKVVLGTQALRRWIIPLAGAWIVILATITFSREAVWHDSLALWSDTAARNPASPAAADNLGWALLDAGRPGDALASFKHAAGLTQGRDPDPIAGAALALDALGRREDAMLALRAAVSLDARYGHPAALVKALTLEEKDAGKLELLLKRTISP